MRRALFVAVLLLGACARPTTRIEVVTTEAATAQLELCGRQPVVMPKTAGGFEVRLAADCRGSGRVTLTYLDGGRLVCPVKIVVPDMPAWYRFQVAGRACRIG